MRGRRSRSSRREEEVEDENRRPTDEVPGLMRVEMELLSDETHHIEHQFFITPRPFRNPSGKKAHMREKRMEEEGEEDKRKLKGKRRDLENFQGSQPKSG